MAITVKVKVKQTGRVRVPKLGNPQLKAIGDDMVKEQLDRWSKAKNADGQPAKKLSVKYAIIKQQYKKRRPVRDMDFTGLTIKNFQLRRAQENQIRAENTTRNERKKAQGANSIDQMIGFAISDAKVVFDATVKQYGDYAKTAWIPLGPTVGKP
jgi:hypothetical protein